MNMQTLIPILLYVVPMIIMLLLYGPTAYSIWLNLYHPSCWSCGKRVPYQEITLFKRSEVVYQRLCKICLFQGIEASKKAKPSIQQWTILDYTLDTTKQERIHS